MFRCYRAAMTLLVAALSSSVFADKTAQDALQSYLPGGCYHTGQYRQERQVAGLSQLLVTEGDFIFACENGLIWHTASPLIETTIYKTAGDHFLLDAANRPTKLDGRVHQALGSLLNHLVGGDAVYLSRHFTAVEETGRVRLTPKQNRLKKFIQYIEIKPLPDAVELWLAHSANEYTHITIFDRREFATMDGSSCIELTPEKATACGLLFQ